jgi:predicted nucleotidyltransferase
MSTEMDDRHISELSRRIAQAVSPRRVILFGSAARGEFGDRSDLDVLVVMPDGIHRGKTSQEIYRNLWGFGLATDVIVVTESDLARYKDDPFLVIKQALEEGRELYRAA